MSKIKNNNPWCHFFYRDWLESESIMEMSCAAEGVYIRCLALQASHGSIPADLKRLAKMLRREQSELSDVWHELAPHFLEEVTEEGETRLYNDKHRSNLQPSKNYSEGAKKGHETRRQNRTKSEENPNENPEQNPTQSHATRVRASASVSVSDSLSESEKEKPDSQPVDCTPPAPEIQVTYHHDGRQEVRRFETTARQQQAAAAHSFETIFWPAWPSPRKDKQAALKAWLKLNPGPELLARIMAGLDQDKRSEQWQKRGIKPHPSTWLNNSRWEDEAEGAPETAPQAAPEPECETLPELTPIDPAVWENARFALKLEDPEAFEAWLETLEPLGYAGEELWLRVHTAFQRRMVAQNYRETLTRHLLAPVRFYLTQGISA